VLKDAVILRSEATLWRSRMAEMAPGDTAALAGLRQRLIL
jgi:hypothetical protein